MFTLIVGSFARGPAPSGRDVPTATAMRITVGAADSGAVPRKTRRTLHLEEHPMHNGHGMSRAGTQEPLDEAGGYSSPVRPYCGRPGAPRCFTKFQSSGKAIISKSCTPTRISKEKLGHTLELRFARQTGQTTAEGFIIVPNRITALRLPSRRNPQ